MGREIIGLGDEDFDYRTSQKLNHLDQSKIQSISNILQEMKSFAPNELRMLFETMFSRMTVGSKEAMTELMWSGLSIGEQQSFELPYFGSRWSNDSISQAFASSFIDRSQLPTERDRGEDREQFRTRSGITGGRTRVLSDHTISHTFSGGFSPSAATTRGTTTRVPPPRSSATNDALSNVIEQDLTSHVRMEEEFYSILRNAIRRAERTVTTTTSFVPTDLPARQRVYSAESDPNGNDLDIEEIEQHDYDMENELM